MFLLAEGGPLSPVDSTLAGLQKVIFSHLFYSRQKLLQGISADRGTVLASHRGTNEHRESLK